MMQRLKLITESSFDVSLNEEKGGDLYVTGIFSSAELENANGRKYRKEILEREVEKIRREHFDKGIPFWGELGHPSTPYTNLDRVAIRTVALEWRGNNLYGKAKVLDTTMGREARVLLKEGPVGISSRGLGTVDKDGYVNENFKLLAYDLVSNPSNPSFVNGIYEAQEFLVYEDIISTNPKCFINLDELENFHYQLSKNNDLFFMKRAVDDLYKKYKNATINDELKLKIEKIIKEIKSCCEKY